MYNFCSQFQARSQQLKSNESVNISTFLRITFNTTFLPKAITHNNLSNSVCFSFVLYFSHLISFSLLSLCYNSLLYHRSALSPFSPSVQAVHSIIFTPLDFQIQVDRDAVLPICPLSSLSSCCTSVCKMKVGRWGWGGQTREIG